MMQDVHVQREEDSFHQQKRFKFKEETSKVLHLGHSFVSTETGLLGKQIRNMKCGAAEEW